jgi:hypothetical protein
MAMTFPKIGFVTEPIAVYYLDRPGTLTEQTTSDKKTAVIRNIIQKSVDLSKQLNCFDRFKPCAQYYLKRLIRAWLFEKDLAPTIKETVRQFDEILPCWYKAIIKALTISPGVTSLILHTISKIVRTFNLRKIVVRPPNK